MLLDIALLLIVLLATPLLLSSMSVLRSKRPTDSVGDNLTTLDRRGSGRDSRAA
jgi:hypothetical protein